MGYLAETGYSLPGGDKPLTHARVLHAGNRFPIKTVTASAEASTTTPAIAVDSALTAERWKPFANGIDSPADLSVAPWATTNVTVGADGQTLDAGTATGLHYVQQAFTYTAAEWVVSFQVERQTSDGVTVYADDGTSSRFTRFDLRDGTVVSNSAGSVGKIVDLGGGAFECRIYFTAAAGTGNARVYFWDAAANESYTGANETFRVLRGAAHLSSATLRLDTFVDQIGDMFAIAGHNLGSSGARITFQHDSNDDDTFTDIEAVSPTDDSPIMLLFAPITSSRWRIRIDRGALPEVAVVRIGAALQMERAIHQGVSPLKNNRQTSVRGNLSEGGAWVGRSTIRTALQGSFDWVHLTQSFIQANLEGRAGLIQAMEREPAFIAWRPATYADAHYVWTTGPLSGPVFNQSPNLSSFSMQVQALGYE